MAKEIHIDISNINDPYKKMIEENKIKKKNIELKINNTSSLKNNEENQIINTPFNMNNSQIGLQTNFKVNQINKVHNEIILLEQKINEIKKDIEIIKELIDNMDNNNLSKLFKKLKQIELQLINNKKLFKDEIIINKLNIVLDKLSCNIICKIKSFFKSLISFKG